MNKEIDISCTVLKTDRLVLRPWTENDLQDFYEYAKVDGVGQMAGWNPHKNLEESKSILDMFISQKKVFCIEYNGKAIGSIGIEEYDECLLPESSDKQGRELGYVLSKDYWGRGLMSEAVRSVIQYLFDDVKLDFIVCSHFIRNQKSRNVQEKMGFKFVKKFDYQTRMNTTEDANLMLLTKSDWLDTFSKDI